MRVVCLQHVSFEDPGCIADWSRSRGHRHAVTHVWKGDMLPLLDEMDALVVMGGPMSANDERAHPWLREEKRLIGAAVEGDKIVLGVCLGAQLIASALGARVYPNRHKEIGWWPVRRSPGAGAIPAFRHFPGSFPAFHWHGETFDLPEGATLLAGSEGCANQAFAFGKHVVGLQFHLEVTRPGVERLIANCAADMAAGPFVQPATAMLGNTRHFENAHMAMNTLLDDLAACILTAEANRPTRTHTEEKPV